MCVAGKASKRAAASAGDEQGCAKRYRGQICTGKAPCGFCEEFACCAPGVAACGCLRYVVSGRAEAEKLRFCTDAVGGSDRFAKAPDLDADLMAAIKWIAERSAEEVCFMLVYLSRLRAPAFRFR